METGERPSKIRRIEGDDPISIPSAGNEEHPVEAAVPAATQRTGGSSSSDEASAKLPLGEGEEAPTQDAPMSKRAKKRLARKQVWEEGRDFRKQKRKEKQVARREKKRQERAEAEDGLASQDMPSTAMQSRPPQPINLPLTFLVDCGFDEQMAEKEIISISAQVTRCYSENRKARYRPQMALSSFGGRMKTRFETVLQNPHARWANFRASDGDFVEVAQQAKGRMLEIPSTILSECSALASSEDVSPEDGETVYLTADSDETLDELRPYSTYIIGGIVDRNRHKGICYKRAKDRGVRTAKLPIGQFMQMNSRAVLATNHVYEIMLRWLELRDWGEAFMKVIPKRKGGVLKSDIGGAQAPADDDDDDDGVEEEEHTIAKDEGQVLNADAVEVEQSAYR